MKSAGAKYKVPNSVSLKTHKGQCFCGQVEFTIQTQQTKFYMCHCSGCQKVYGNLFASYFQVKKNQFKLHKGEIKIFNSSKNRQRAFCSHCGTQIYYDNKETDKLDISVGILENFEELEPVAHIHVTNKHFNLKNIECLKQYDD